MIQLPRHSHRHHLHLSIQHIHLRVRYRSSDRHPSLLPSRLSALLAHRCVEYVVSSVGPYAFTNSRRCHSPHTALPLSPVSRLPQPGYYRTFHTLREPSSSASSIRHSSTAHSVHRVTRLPSLHTPPNLRAFSPRCITSPRPAQKAHSNSHTDASKLIESQLQHPRQLPL